MAKQLVVITEGELTSIRLALDFIDSELGSICSKVSDPEILEKIKNINGQMVKIASVISTDKGAY